MPWMQKSKSKGPKNMSSINLFFLFITASSIHLLHNNSIYLLTTSHPSSPITWFLKKLSIFIIHILIPFICTRQWYLWPDLLELWSVLVRHVASPGHTMSPGCFGISQCRLKGSGQLWLKMRYLTKQLDTKIQTHDMNIHETWVACKPKNPIARVTTPDLVRQYHMAMYGSYSSLGMEPVSPQKKRLWVRLV